MTRLRTFVAALGDVDDVRTQSGRPYHFCQVAKRQGLADEGLRLSTSSVSYRLSRLGWSCRRVAAGHRPGGFVYSRAGVEALWRPMRGRMRDVRLINCNQLVPDWVIEDASVAKWFFVDQPLSELFIDYDTRPQIADVARSAIAREQEGYRAAEWLIVPSRWAARRLVDAYGIDLSRIAVIQPGAGLDPELYAQWEKAEALGRTEFGRGAVAASVVRFVFVGSDWKRKGLDRLLMAHRMARRRGSTAIVRVIGCHPTSLPAELREISGVEWHGPIDKRSDGERFLRLVSECDVGVLVSRAEASGLSVREFAALGLAVLATTAGGVAEQTFPGASALVDPDVDATTLADLLHRVATDDDWRQGMRHEAWQRHREALWSASVEKMLRLDRGH